jgi:hypothetical protein
MFLQLLTLNRWGNLNGIVASNIYVSKDAPRYQQGHGVVLGYLVVFLFGGSIITTLYLRAENKKRVTGRRDAWADGKSTAEVEKLGDMR